MRDTREPGMQLKRKNPARAGKVFENIYMKAAIPAFLSKSFMTKKTPTGQQENKVTAFYSGIGHKPILFVGERLSEQITVNGNGF